MRFISSLLAVLLLLDQSLLLVSFNFIRAITNARSTSVLQLNRIFCDIEEIVEIDNGADTPQSMILNLDNNDNRCKHIKTILKLEAGDTIKGTSNPFLWTCVSSFRNSAMIS